MSVRPLGRSYAALARFLDGYLHQDFRIEHRSAAGAARAFARVASEREQRDVVRQLRRFIDSADEKSPAEWQHALTGIGGAWRPDSLDDLRALLPILRPE